MKSWLTIWLRLAPKAVRSEISLLRSIARLVSSPATLKQAMKRIKPTVAISNRREGRIERERSACKPTTRTPCVIALSGASLRLMAASSSCAECIVWSARRSARSPKGLVASDIGALKRFIELLNTEDYWSASLIEGRQRIGGDYRGIQKELRRLVRAWFRSGPNVNKLFDADPMLDRAARSFQPYSIPVKGGNLKLAFLTAPEYLPGVAPLEIALGLFLPFLLNPYNEKLGGPCKNCGSYYLKESKRKKHVYCSKRCGHRLTARLANKARREREHKKLLKLAKVWVSGRTLIKKHWLTLAVRNGEIVEPVKRRRGSTQLD
jgi:hypothetical protein